MERNKARDMQNHIVRSELGAPKIVNRSTYFRRAGRSTVWHRRRAASYPPLPRNKFLHCVCAIPTGRAVENPQPAALSKGTRNYSSSGGG